MTSKKIHLSNEKFFTENSLDTSTCIYSFAEANIIATRGKVKYVEKMWLSYSFYCNITI